MAITREDLIALSDKLKQAPIPQRELVTPSPMSGKLFKSMMPDGAKFDLVKSKALFNMNAFFINKQLHVSEQIYEKLIDPTTADKAFDNLIIVFHAMWYQSYPHLKSAQNSLF